MARFFCERCERESNFLPIYVVVKIEGVSRSTIYYWTEHGWLHLARIAESSASYLRIILSWRSNPSEWAELCDYINPA